MANRKQGSQEAKNWCFDGSAGDAAGVETAHAWRVGNLFRVAWGRPVAACSGPEFKGYRGIRA